MSRSAWILLAVVPLLVIPARAASREAQLKAAFVYRLATFVSWPDHALSGSETFCVGVLGEDPFGPVLDASLEGRKVGGRPVTITRAADASALAACQVVFVSESEAARLPPLLAALSRGSILTISDLPGFAGRGGMIGLVDEGAHVRFEINAGAARSAGLRVSSKLLHLATQVFGAN